MPLSHGSAKSFRQRSTDAERLLWNKLRNRQIENCKFRRQQPIGKYVVDLVCLERRLVIEVDGGQHALRESEDLIRTEFLKAEGYRVLRFWNNQVLADLEDVLEAIYLTLAQAAYSSYVVSPRPSLARLRSLPESPARPSWPGVRGPRRAALAKRAIPSPSPNPLPQGERAIARVTRK